MATIALYAGKINQSICDLSGVISSIPTSLQTQEQENNMRKYYLMRIIYKNKRLFVIWYGDEEDGFVIKSNRLLTFESIGDAKTFAEKTIYYLKGRYQHMIFRMLLS